MLTELPPRASEVLARACQRLTRQQWYNQKHMCIGHFKAERGKRVEKVENIIVDLDMTRDDYFTVSTLSMRLYIAT
jgi:hypothetical protein